MGQKRAPHWATIFTREKGCRHPGNLEIKPCNTASNRGKNLDQIWIAEGEIIGCGYHENLCRTQVEITLDEDGLVGDLLKRPLGNHLVLAAWHHGKRLSSWWEMYISQRNPFNSRT